MARQIRLQAVPEGERAMRLQYHALGLAGYAFALAQRAGLTPEEAARLWLAPLMPPAGDSPSAAEPDELAAWVERNAGALQVFHDKVELWRDGENWSISIDIAEERGDLERWGMPADFWAGWMAEQTRQLGTRYGFRSEVRLDGDVLRMQFRA